MARYAANTTVSPERSLEEIKRTLRRYGADKFCQMEDPDWAAIMFAVNGLTVRIDVPIPDPSGPEFTQSEAGRARKPAAALAAFEAVLRQRWRALLLAIKAKLEAVDCGISTLEIEFMPFIVMPDGRTVGEHLLPKLEDAVKRGRIPQLFLLGPTAEAAGAGAPPFQGRGMEAHK